MASGETQFMSGDVAEAEKEGRRIDLTSNDSELDNEHDDEHDSGSEAMKTIIVNSQSHRSFRFSGSAPIRTISVLTGIEDAEKLEAAVGKQVSFQNCSPPDSKWVIEIRTISNNIVKLY